MLKDLKTISNNLLQHMEMIRDLERYNENKQSDQQSSVVGAGEDEEAAIAYVNQQFVERESDKYYSDDDDVEIQSNF
jgi:hypothetical protein